MFLKQYRGRGGDSESDEFEAKTEDILKQDRGAVEIQERCSIILVFDKILVFEAEVQERCLIKSWCLKQRSYEQCWFSASAAVFDQIPMFEAEVQERYR